MEDAKIVKNTILDGTIRVFKKKGLRFTMDDLAKELGMSKKTIYMVFQDKEQMFLEMVDYLFDSIKVSEQEIYENDALSTLEKVEAILGAMPDSYKEIDFVQLYLLRGKYPTIYEHVEYRLETGWERTIELMEQGMREGVIRPVSVTLVKVMMEATLEQFFQRDVLVKNKISYPDALQGVVDILIRGIAVK